MGMTGNETIFPRNVMYNGVDLAPRAYRGETGAQDSMIPVSDSILEVTFKSKTESACVLLVSLFSPS
jgi:hypothetical protein